MFKTLMGLVLGYGVFNAEGRKMMNKLGNGVISMVEKQVNKFTKLEEKPAVKIEPAASVEPPKPVQQPTTIIS